MCLLFLGTPSWIEQRTQNMHQNTNSFAPKSVQCFQTLKQINMNLSQFVDTGKIDDVISFQDVGVLFVFEMEVSLVNLSENVLFDQSLSRSTMAVSQRPLAAPIQPAQQPVPSNPYLQAQIVPPPQIVPQNLPLQVSQQQRPMEMVPQIKPQNLAPVSAIPPQQLNIQKQSEPEKTSQPSIPIEYTVLKQNALLERQNEEIASLKQVIVQLSTKLSKQEETSALILEELKKKAVSEQSLADALTTLKDDIEQLKKGQEAASAHMPPPMMFPPPHYFYGHPQMMGGAPSTPGTPGQAGAPPMGPPGGHPHHAFPPFYPPPPHYYAQPNYAGQQQQSVQKSSIADKSIDQESSIFEQFNNSQDQVSQHPQQSESTNQQFQNLTLSGGEEKQL